MLSGAGVGIYQPNFAVVGKPAGPCDYRRVGAKIAPDYVELVLCLLMVLNKAKFIRMQVRLFAGSHGACLSEYIRPTAVYPRSLLNVWLVLKAPHRLPMLAIFGW